MTDKEKIRNIIELFIAWNGETDVIDVANIDSAVEFIANSLQEEPISEGKDIFDNYLKSEEKFILPQKISGNIDCENCLYSSACALGDIKECIIDKPVSEDLGEYINELSKQFPEVSFAKLSRIAVRVAKWQKEQMISKSIDAELYSDGTFIPLIGVKDKEKISDIKFGDKIKVILIKNN